jgi:hypothetical protein
MVYPYFGFKLHDLETLSNLSNTSIRLGTRQYELLCYFVEKPGGSAYDIGRVSTKNAYRVARRRIQKLKDWKLLEVTKHPTIHDGHYYKLSADGVYHIIANKDSLKYGILNNLIKNYWDHPLFQYFLYPCIEQETLLKLRDSAIFSHIFSYLHDCCQLVKDTINMISHTYNQQNGNLTQYLFSWDNISNKDKDRLSFFLKEKFKWNWVDNAEINKTEDGNSIKISHGSDSALITLSEDKTNATLKYRGPKPLEFDVKGSHIWTSELPALAIANIKSSTNGYGNFKSNLVNTAIRNYVNQHTSVEKTYMESFMISLHMRVQQLIFSILSNHGPELGYKSAAIRILSHDSKFMQALKETQDQSEKRYNLFVERKINLSPEEIN